MSILGCNVTTFDNELVHVIPRILTERGFISPFHAGDNKTRYRLEYECIGVFLATGKLPQKKVKPEPVTVAPVPASASAPVDAFELFRAQYAELVVPLQLLETGIAERQIALQVLNDKVAELEGRRRQLDLEKEVLDREITDANQGISQAQFEYSERSNKLAPGLREKLEKIMETLKG